MDSRREFLKRAALLSGGAGLASMLPPSIQKALAIDPAPGSTYLDAEHVVFLMQENRSFDHCFGSLQGVRGFNDPRAITLPNQHPVWLQTNAEGETYAPFRLDLHNTKATWMGGLPHSWSDQVDALNNGKYDTWLIAKRYGNEEYKNFPMAMGYYTREDLPFYYALADAFTVCDQHFCSSLTGTTPNRLYFWSGTIREDAGSKARVWNGDTNYETNARWTTFPERLEANGVSWRIYQNELSVGAGLTSEEDAWLANFTDNPLEWFEQYHVKLSAGYIGYLKKAPDLVTADIKQLEEALKSATGKKAEALQKQINRKKQYLDQVIAEQKIYTKERYDQLPDLEKNLHNKAFTTNRTDPFYHQLTSLRCKDSATESELVIPKGDILHQFRKDVAEGKLPTVSWLVAPEKFSDHPSAPWYGAWYVSEVLDILTQNPEVWKKTIFILTYDENDGYFDHVPPFVAPHKPRSGLVSEGIDPAAEYVSKQGQHSDADDVRESPIGLGYRVPMVVVSPWSRGGWVNSQVFDHTSNLQFLEKFLQHKISKPIHETNITDWRRCICGNLTSAFRPYNGEKIDTPKPVEKEPFIESIYQAKFKKAPGGWAPLSAADIARIKQAPLTASRLPQQEKGVRSSCALPYELYADGKLNADRKTFDLTFFAGNEIFGAQAAGAPFKVYAPGKYAVPDHGDLKKFEAVRAWDYAVRAGGRLNDRWRVADFEKGFYHLKVYGPNGFYREFSGTQNDPELSIVCGYEQMKNNPKTLTGNIVLTFKNESSGEAYNIEIEDQAYKRGARRITLNKDATATEVINLSGNFNWYDVVIKIKGNPAFKKRYAGCVETGKEGKTDPFMGGLQS